MEQGCETWKQFETKFGFGVCIYKVELLQLLTCERVFISAGNTVTSLRNRLDAGKVENLFIVKLNVNLLKEIGKLKWCIQRKHVICCCLWCFCSNQLLNNVALLFVLIDIFLVLVWYWYCWVLKNQPIPIQS